MQTLVHKMQTAGTYQVEWDGKDDLGQQVSAGIYLYRLTIGSNTQTRKMILLK